jgi:hypothetical protein
LNKKSRAAGRADRVVLRVASGERANRQTLISAWLPVKSCLRKHFQTPSNRGLTALLLLYLLTFNCWPSADRGHMEYDPFVDLPGGENFRDVTALFEDAAEGDQICLR